MIIGASYQNRTDVLSLEGCGFTIKLMMLEINAATYANEQRGCGLVWLKSVMQALCDFVCFPALLNELAGALSCRFWPHGVFIARLSFVQPAHSAHWLWCLTGAHFRLPEG